jgi:hypothetical protein
MKAYQKYLKEALELAEKKEDDVPEVEAPVEEMPVDEPATADVMGAYESMKSVVDQIKTQFKGQIKIEFFDDGSGSVYKRKGNTFSWTEIFKFANGRDFESGMTE